MFPIELVGARKELTALQANILRQTAQLYAVLGCGDPGFGVPKLKLGAFAFLRFCICEAHLPFGRTPVICKYLHCGLFCRD